jgi:uncharacterized protein
MLIEFKVANFRSIREMQTLSLVATNADKELPENLIDTALPGLSGMKFLKGAALYGANASGKSNVLEAVSFLVNLVTSSATTLAPGAETGAQPFKLDMESGSAPSEFEITFVVEGTRYVYFASLTKQRIIEESLDAYPKGSPQHWFRRCFHQETGAYEWNSSATYFKGGSELRKRTRENALYLSVGAQFNHPQLSTVFGFFDRELKMAKLGANTVIRPFVTLQLFQDDESRMRIGKLLKSADTGIIAMRMNAQDANVSPEEAKKILEQQFPHLEAKPKMEFALKTVEIEFAHGMHGEEYTTLDYHTEESEGTRQYFSLIGPWLDVLDNGYTLFVDEIETSLHPLLVKALLRLFFNNDTNPQGAQVVFTTHNPILLDTALLRRDQIWFTEKSADGVTHLYPLTDFKPRKDEAIAKGYLAGRYGGIPFIPEGLEL